MILVTGGTGFLGGHLVDLLLRDGDPVRVFCRNAPSTTVFDRSRVTFQYGDVRDPGAVERAIAGATRVYHVAGLVDFNPKTMVDLLAVNRDGTRNVMEACRRHGVERVVHVSSVSTIGAADDFEHPLNESHFGTGRGLDIPYPQSKYEAEKVALAAADKGLPVVIANPTFFCGPADLHLSSARTILSYMMRQVWVGLDRGGLGYTDVRDVAAGLRSCMNVGRPGERYILGGHNLRLKDYHAEIAKVTGLSPPFVRVPPRLASILAQIGQIAYGAVGIKTYVSSGDVRLAKHYWVYDYSKAHTELGLTCRPVAESLRDSIAWLAEHGYVRLRKPLN